MSIVQLPDNKFVAGSIFEITAFPKAEIIDQDSKKTFETNRGVFRQLCFELHKISDIHSTVAEILWVAEKVENQTFKSKVRFLLCLEKSAIMWKGLIRPFVLFRPI